MNPATPAGRLDATRAPRRAARRGRVVGRFGGFACGRPDAARRP